jgi:hypothetical protein
MNPMVLRSPAADAEQREDRALAPCGGSDAAGLQQGGRDSENDGGPEPEQGLLPETPFMDIGESLRGD